VTYCGSFPILFKAIDQEIDGGRAEGSENVNAETVHAVTDHCWQCKLCYIKCPYTPDEGAHELLDFPRLMAREKAQRSRRDGVPPSSGDFTITPGAADARRALAMALACIESVKRGAPVAVNETAAV